MKGDSSMTISDLKHIIREANKPNSRRAGANLKLTGSKKELQDRLKSVGRWREIKSSPKKAPVKKAPVKKAPVKKPRKKTYYVGYDMLDDETYDLFGGDYKHEQSYGVFSLFSIKSTREPDDPFWENAPYRSNKKFDYDDRMDNKV